MNRFALAVYTILITLVLSVYLPMLYDKMFVDPVEKTHLFYSPVSHDFILKEKIVGKIPDAARGMALDHHSNLAYRMADGTYVPRKTFEQHLPFIYYKNMEIWGLLPITLDGRTFDKDSIKADRRVLELKARDLPGNSPLVPFFPLLESNPGQARLVFPEDRFRMTDTAMEFIDAHTCTLDTVLTKMYTMTLKKKGFKFPARSVNGRFSVLKPFDEGVFIVDNDFQVFHIKRVDDKPVIKKTPISPDLKIRAVKVSENKLKKDLGLALSGDGRLFILGYDNYRLTPIALPGYDPGRMDVKLIFNPLNCTAVYSDDKVIRAVVMDRQLTPFKTFVHIMSRAAKTRSTRIRDILFPFRLKIGATEKSDYVTAQVVPGTRWSVLGMVICTCLFIAGTRVFAGTWPRAPGTIFVGLTGIYGLPAMVTAALCDKDVI